MVQAALVDQVHEQTSAAGERGKEASEANTAAGKTKLDHLGSARSQQTNLSRVREY